jgi:hypothetical protein
VFVYSLCTVRRCVLLSGRIPAKRRVTYAESQAKKCPEDDLIEVETFWLFMTATLVNFLNRCLCLNKVNYSKTPCSNLI